MELKHCLFDFLLFDFLMEILEISRIKLMFIFIFMMWWAVGGMFKDEMTYLEIIL